MMLLNRAGTARGSYTQGKEENHIRPRQGWWLLSGGVYTPARDVAARTSHQLSVFLCCCVGAVVAAVGDGHDHQMSIPKPLSVAEWQSTVGT
jgi:hypothetical protein